MDFERGGTAPHGQKRRAQEDLCNDQRLVKRFNLLNLDHNGKLYTAPQPQKLTSGANGYDGSMQLDDTKEKIYIYNLDDELRAVDEDKEQLVFLPDIERKLNKIPKSVLRDHSQPTTNSEVVLYQVPASLSVPEDQDNVRKAIIESRTRLRERQAEEATLGHNGKSTTSPPINSVAQLGHNTAVAIEDDEDAMDLG